MAPKPQSLSLYLNWPSERSVKPKGERSMAVSAFNMPYMALMPSPTDHCSLKRYATLGTSDKPSRLSFCTK
ncbi:hypothetical protein D3C72_2182130 [compost metagenome]